MSESTDVNIIRVLVLLSALWFSASADAQPLNNKIQEYHRTLDGLHETSTAYQVRTLQQRGQLNMHLFNLSYTRSIGVFLRFKNMFHIAAAGSDIPWNYSPVKYLHQVISVYNAENAYRVAILYYDDGKTDSAGEVRDLINGEKPLDAEVQEMENFRNENLQVNWSKSTMRVWYLSENRLDYARTGISYQKVFDAEQRYRQETGVNQLAISRSPRGMNLPLTENTVMTVGTGTDAALELSSMLLPARIRRMMEADSINGVIVIPYGNIGQIPFLALPLEKHGDSVVYFADRYACNIAPHMCNFFRVFRDNLDKVGRQNRLSPQKPLVVGNPQYYSDGQYSFPDLPGAAWEARTVAEMLGTTALTGATARYDTVLRRLKHSDFVYFATHAVPSYSDPTGGSFIALTPTSRNNSGRLTLKTIQDSTTKTTRLAVLSACQTGVGKLYKNGYCNMGRGFYIAGVDNTIMSLWNLDDQNIVPFMTTLVEELQKPQHFYPAENLRQAALRYKRINPNPAYWSAMVNFGVAY